MESIDLRRLLNEGIKAAKGNDRALARERLLRVLEADDRSEPAWLWLSAVLDEPGDQLMALERVLAINPRHPQALAGANALRQRLGKADSTVQPPGDQPASDQAALIEPPGLPLATVSQPQIYEQAPAATFPVEVLPAEPTATPYDTLAAEDDPDQCAYCGRRTHPDDDRCRHCGRSLLVPGPWRGGGYLYLALLISGIHLQLALVQALASYLVTSYPQAASILPLAALWVSHLLLPAVLRAVAWTVVVLLLLSDVESGYGIAAMVAAMDLAWAGIGYKFHYLGPAQAGANAALGVVIFLIALLAVISQAQSRRRLRVVLDRNLEGAVMIHRRAMTYAHQGKWALAALHWRRAISRASSEPLYYKALGRANVRLGRYAEAVRAFKSGAEAAPNDREFNRLIERVRALARSS
jgi:tetratricopeptide (TPR) repeat protein